MFPILVDVEEALRELVAGLDPAVVHGPDAAVALERFSTIEKMAATGRMLMGRRVAETNAWKASGAASAEHFLAKVAGCSLAEARRLLGTAKKLADLPDTDKAARSGDLSPGQAGDIADAAAADPSAEQDLLDLAAEASAAELREEARRRRHAACGDDARRHRRIRDGRSLRSWTGDDGSAHLHWNHLPEAGAEVGAILEEYIEDQFHHARRSGRRERREAYAADAFVDALRDAAAYRRGGSIHDDADTDVGQSEPIDGADASDGARPVCVTGATGGVGGDRHVGASGPPDDEPLPVSDDAVGGRSADLKPDRSRGSSADQPAGEAPGRRGRGRRRGADAKVIVVIDHAALIRGHTEAGETCTIAGIGAVPVASVEALLPDAFVAAVVKKGVDVHTVAHLGRQPSAFQDTALQAQGIECSTLGCPNRAHLERDHRTPFRVTRHTKLTELDYSCRTCHDRKTYEGAMLAPGTGKRPLLSRAEQAQWNLDHPDNPVDPPQTSYPNRPTPPPPNPPGASRPRAPSARSRRASTTQELTLDL